MGGREGCVSSTGVACCSSPDQTGLTMNHGREKVTDTLVAAAFIHYSALVKASHTKSRHLCFFLQPSEDSGPQPAAIGKDLMYANTHVLMYVQWAAPIVHQQPLLSEPSPSPSLLSFMRQSLTAWPRLASASMLGHRCDPVYLFTHMLARNLFRKPLLHRRH